MHKITKTNDPVRVIISDNNLLSRNGIIHYLNKLPYKIIIEQHSDNLLNLKLRNSNVIIIINLKNQLLKPLSILSFLKDLNLYLKIILITDENSDKNFKRYLESGATSILTSTTEFNVFKLAINAVLGGEIFIHPNIEKNIKMDKKNIDNIFSPREVEIIKLICLNHSSKKISELISISIHTVNNHRSNINKKIISNNLISIQNYGIKSGLVNF